MIFKIPKEKWNTWKKVELNTEPMPDECDIKEVVIPKSGFYSLSFTKEGVKIKILPDIKP